MKTFRIAVAACLAVVLGEAGCVKKAEIQFVATDPVLQWQDLQLPDDVEVHDGYTLLEEQQTTGLFPTAVAVVRIRADYTDAGPPATMLELNTEPETELLPWNSLLDDQRAISGVFPIKPIALQGEDVTVEHLLKTAEVMKASVCLIYATADLSQTESEVRGAIYDARRLKPLAVLCAHARIENLDEALADLPKPAPMEPRYFDAAKDPRYHDAPGMAIYKFEALVRECVIALRKNDTPLENQPTEGWMPQPPPDGVFWRQWLRKGI